MQNTATDLSAAVAIYRSSYPDITPQEAAALYPLFLKATEAGQAPEQWQHNWKLYQDALAPIRERNQPKKPQHYFQRGKP